MGAPEGPLHLLDGGPRRVLGPVRQEVAGDHTSGSNSVLIATLQRMSRGAPVMPDPGSRGVTLGLRPVELRYAEWEDVNWDKRFLFIRRSHANKTPQACQNQPIPPRRGPTSRLVAAPPVAFGPATTAASAHPRCCSARSAP